MEKYCLVTGAIAYKALCKVVQQIPDKNIRIVPLGCTVAALMTTEFIAKEIVKTEGLSEEEIIVIPGLCQGSIEAISEATRCEVRRGPKELSDLPRFFDPQNTNLLCHDFKRPIPKSPINIVAEIVDAPRMTLKQIMEKALYYQQSGADIIDLGGDVHHPFPKLQEIILCLKQEGYKVSVDSHQRQDIQAANKAGADLILSFNAANLELAKDVGCPVVVIPDDGEDLNSLYASMEKLEKWNIKYLVDPILPPLTMGLAEGIGRYLQVRKDFPHCEMFMGLGNVTELLDADSIGLNAILVGVAGELGINYLLSTEVSHRARGSIREISLARDLINQALEEKRLPKHIGDKLLTIKDPVDNSFTQDELREMQEVIRDKNYRIFVADQIYVFNAHGFWYGKSAQELWPLLKVKDSSHAFYLGRELEKAETALGLGKNYIQDRPLRWGYLSY